MMNLEGVAGTMYVRSLLVLREAGGDVVVVPGAKEALVSTVLACRCRTFSSVRLPKKDLVVDAPSPPSGRPRRTSPWTSLLLHQAAHEGPRRGRAYSSVRPPMKDLAAAFSSSTAIAGSI
jgi:hypothetical protein